MRKFEEEVARTKHSKVRSREENGLERDGSEGEQRGGGERSLEKGFQMSLLSVEICDIQSSSFIVLIGAVIRYCA